MEIWHRISLVQGLYVLLHLKFKDFFRTFKDLLLQIVGSFDTDQHLKILEDY